MQKKKSGVKKCLEICAIKGGGVGPLMANAIKNFHFDYLNTSLTRKNDAFDAKIVSTCLTKIFIAIFAPDERLPSSATLYMTILTTMTTITTMSTETVI